MSLAPTSLLIVIVNYRTAELVVECLKSLSTEVHGNAFAHVAVVDNASGDGSTRKIEQAIVDNNWTEWVQAVEAPLNGGFSYGNNFAIRTALASDKPPDYFWLLNPDTEVRPGALRAMTDFLCSHPQAGICGSGIDNGDGSEWPFAFRFPSAFSEVESAISFGPVTKTLAKWKVLRQMSNVPEQVDWVCGASMLVRREVFAAVGLMDEGYFLYYEETDFCLQARRAGWQCWYAPEGRVLHISGQSTGVTAKSDTPKRLPQYWFNSRRRYFVKNHGRLYAASTDIVWMVAFFIGSVVRRLRGKPSIAPPKYLADFFKYSALWQSGVSK